MSSVKFLWASPHQPTTEQLSSLEERGEVIYLKEVNPEMFGRLVNQEINDDLITLAEDVVEMCSTEHIHFLVQPGGSPAFQCTLGKVLESMSDGYYDVAVPAVAYAFSKRVSEDIPQPDGSVKKVSTFIHEGWVYC